jgi:hypothetical protein
MTIVYYVCYNEVSYLVAAEHALCSASEDDSTILYATDRITVRDRYRRVRHRPLNRIQLASACASLMTAGSSMVYVPHHRVPRSVAWLMRSASSWSLVDDGLDTLRERPKNIDIGSLTGRPSLLTFRDYSQLAGWTRAVDIIPVCSLSMLARDDQPRIDLSRYQTIVIESPGVDLSQLPNDVVRQPEAMLIFAHGNPNKRGAVREPCATTASGRHSLESAISDFHGDVVCGESMATVYAIHCARTCRLTIQFQREQYDNLLALHGAIAVSGARLSIL